MCGAGIPYHGLLSTGLGLGLEAEGGVTRLSGLASVMHRTGAGR